MVRLVGGCCLLAVLALACSGALLARPVVPMPLPGDSQPAGGAVLLTTPDQLALEVSAAEPALLAGANQPVAPGSPEAGDQAVAPASPQPQSQVAADVQAGTSARPGFPAWADSTRETGLWAGPEGDALFTKVPPGATFRVFDRAAGRLRVFYPGDRASRAPGEAWVDAADVAESAWPRWVRLRSPASIVSQPVADSAALARLARGAFVEVLGETRGTWAQVYFLGDGRLAPVEGWLEVEPTAPIARPELISGFALSRELLAGGDLDTWVKVPYRSQLDGTPYAEANCGPTVANMVLESYGFKVPQADLRREVLSLQPDEDCDDCGVYLQNLAEVIARRGLKIVRLRDDNPEAFHAWTQNEIKAELRAGRPVVAQVFYRRLPVRATSGYWGDHYIVLTGVMGDRFIFNDPIDVEGPGYSRLITAEALELAMRESDYPYAAFSVSK
jgi:hypothetical protein